MLVGRLVLPKMKSSEHWQAGALGGRHCAGGRRGALSLSSLGVGVGDRSKHRLWQQENLCTGRGGLLSRDFAFLFLETADSLL